MRDIEYFKKCVGGSFWKKLNESLVPHNRSIPDKHSFLDNLYTQLSEKKYQPDLVRECIVSNKHNKVARIVPAFTKKDYCVYFYCLKCIENFLCNERVEGTYGAWTLNNGMKDAEIDEVAKIEENIINDAPSSPDNSYNPFAWREHWKDFQKKAYYHYLDEDYVFILKFDIANFYDCVRLDLLENRVLSTLYKFSEPELDELGNPFDSTDEVELLFYFLKFWNRKLEGYKPKNVGLPQDEVGDCSRILANFYLQPYDKKIKELCDEEGVEYLRYADDQLFFAKDEKTARKLLFEASKELHKIGLNINPSKVDEFDRDNFAIYWSFDIFEQLTDDNVNNKDAIEIAVNLFFYRKDSDVKFRGHTVLNRLLSCDLNSIEPSLKYRLLSYFMDKEYLGLGGYRTFRNINNLLTKEQKEEFYKVLDDLVDEINFNYYHYNLLKFYKAYRKEHDLSELENRIRLLKI